MEDEIFGKPAIAKVSYTHADMIDYIIMNHNEPDHSGSLAKLLELVLLVCI